MNPAAAVAAGVDVDLREVGRSTIAEEAAALSRLHENLGPSFDEAATALVGLRGKVLTLGVGKSGHAAQKVAGTLRSVGLPALFLNASDSLHGDLGVVEAGDVAMLFSKSGTTQELLVLIPHLRSRGVRLIAVVGNADSPAARRCDIVLDASVEREGCPMGVAPMASIIVALALGDALAAAVTQARGFTSEDFARLHPAGALGAQLSLSVSDVMRRNDDLSAVGTDATLLEAVLEITRTRSGAVCILDGDERLAGFVTDGDVRRQVLKTSDLAGIEVTEIMNRSPLTVRPELPLSQALLVLEQGPRQGFLQAPVVDEDGRCVGLVRLHEVVRAHLPG